MTAVSDAKQLFTEKHASYARFIRFFRYPQGIRAFFLRSPLLRSGLRVLDAGCGTGVVTLSLRDALLRRGLTPGSLHAFDLTPAMLEQFRDKLRERHIDGVETTLANVLQLDKLPDAWRQYDLIVTASMLEYLPRDKLACYGAGENAANVRDGGIRSTFAKPRSWPLSALRLEAAIGGGEQAPVFLWADVLRSVIPTLEQAGIATEAEIDPDTLEERLRADLTATGEVMISIVVVGAWSRTASAAC